MSTFLTHYLLQPRNSLFMIRQIDNPFTTFRKTSALSLVPLWSTMIVPNYRLPLNNAARAAVGPVLSRLPDRLSRLCLFRFPQPQTKEPSKMSCTLQPIDFFNSNSFVSPSFPLSRFEVAQLSLIFTNILSSHSKTSILLFVNRFTKNDKLPHLFTPWRMFKRLLTARDSAFPMTQSVLFLGSRLAVPLMAPIETSQYSFPDKTFSGTIDVQSRLRLRHSSIMSISPNLAFFLLRILRY